MASTSILGARDVCVFRASHASIRRPASCGAVVAVADSHLACFLTRSATVSAVAVCVNKYECTMDQELTSIALGGLAGSRRTLLNICCSERRTDVK